MKFVASSAEVKNLIIEDGEPTFLLDGVRYWAKGQPFIDQGGAPAEVYYSQDLFSWCVYFERNVSVGRLRYEIINSESEDESEACDWLKFDVYLD